MKLQTHMTVHMFSMYLYFHTVSVSVLLTYMKNALDFCINVQSCDFIVKEYNDNGNLKF